jgi:hypothetical protein
MNENRHPTPSSPLFRRPTVLACVGAGLRQAVSWPLLWRWLLGLWLPTLILVWPLWRWSSQALDHSVLGQRLQTGLDPALLAEVFLLGSKNGPGVASAWLLASLMLFLLLPYLHSWVVQTIQARAFGGATTSASRRAWANYPVLLRLQGWAWFGALLGLALGGVLSSSLQAWASRQVLEWPVSLLQGVLVIGMAGLLVLWQFSLDAAKVELALGGGQQAWALWVRGWRRCQQRPVGFGVWVLVVTATIPFLVWLAAQRAATDTLGDWHGLKAWFWLELLIVAMVIGRTARVFALARAWR